MIIAVKLSKDTKFETRPYLYQMKITFANPEDKETPSYDVTYLPGLIFPEQETTIPYILPRIKFPPYLSVLVRYDIKKSHRTSFSTPILFKRRSTFTRFWTRFWRISTWRFFVFWSVRKLDNDPTLSIKGNYNQILFEE
jgi:hypothetical protein